MDDDGGAAEFLARRLSLRRIAAICATNGAEALRTLKEKTPDLVLLDVQMPQMNGLELLEAIRKQFTAAEVPVIVLTADDNRQTMLAAIGGGANDFISKPLDFEALMARIAIYLRVRSEFRSALAEQGRLQRRLDARARLEELGYGDANRRNHLIEELDRAINTDEIELHYQPQLRLRQRTIESAEALMRWQSPRLGVVPADQFIPLAEDSGQIGALTEWAVARAIKDHTALASAGHQVRFAVNLSAVVASDVGLVDRLLEQIGEAPKAISLELTELAIFDNPELAIINLRRFADAGVRVAIDDYGTGMSSLSYIQRLPVHELKIDRMFISKLTSSHRDPLLVRSTIELAHALDFEVVAEGVEDAETMALLSVMGCDSAQGYFVGAPMSLSDLTAFLSAPERRGDNQTTFDVGSFLRTALTGNT